MLSFFRKNLEILPKRSPTLRLPEEPLVWKKLSKDRYYIVYKIAEDCTLTFRSSGSSYSKISIEIAGGGRSRRYSVSMNLLSNRYWRYAYVTPTVLHNITTVCRNYRYSLFESKKDNAGPLMFKNEHGDAQLYAGSVWLGPIMPDFMPVEMGNEIIMIVHDVAFWGGK